MRILYENEVIEVNYAKVEYGILKVINYKGDFIQFVPDGKEINSNLIKYLVLNGGIELNGYKKEIGWEI